MFILTMMVIEELATQSDNDNNVRKMNSATFNNDNRSRINNDIKRKINNVCFTNDNNERIIDDTTLTMITMEKKLQYIPQQ